jgi:DNA-binding Lrp family transcriptional regulator
MISSSMTLESREPSGATEGSQLLKSLWEISMSTLAQADVLEQAKPKTWRDTLPIHPAAELFPLMSEPELKELADDIKKNGLQNLITLCNHKNALCVLDGRNRLDAMELAGMKTTGDDVNIFRGCKTDPYEFVLSANIHRRHLTSEQKRDLIAKLLKAKPEQSDRQIAKQTKTSPTTVGKIRKEAEANGTAMVDDLTTALWKMNSIDWRGDYEGWFALLMGAKYVGISLEAFIEWSVRDPVYAEDAEDIARQWRGIEPKHGGALFAALKARGISTTGGTQRSEVPPASSGAVSRHHNKTVGDRLIGACVSFKRNPTERNLFSHACLIAEIVHQHKLVPRWYRTAAPYMGLLKAAAMETELGRMLGRGGVERTIERAFAHIAMKHKTNGEASA